LLVHRHINDRGKLAVLEVIIRAAIQICEIILIIKIEGAGNFHTLYIIWSDIFVCSIFN
jgi:hypothetical protein